MSGAFMLNDLLHDLRQALRQFSASPVFTVTTIVTLALGIGASTAMFGIEHIVTEVSIDVANPSTLVHIGQAPKDECGACGALASGNFTSMRQSARTLTDFAFLSSWRPVLRGVDRAEVLSGARVTAGFFDALGVRPIVGRTFGAADSVGGQSNVAVLSESFWKTRFGGDSTVVGRTIVLDGTPRVVIGVIPRAGALPEGSAVWVPVVFDQAALANHTAIGDGEAFARLRPGTSLAAARAEITTMGVRLAASNPAGLRGIVFDAETFTDWVTPSREDDLPLYVAVGMVLVVACVNLAGLLLARLTMRSREIAVRSALGASRWRIVRQLLTETVLVTLAGGIAGAGVAALCIRFVRDDMPGFIANAVPRWHELRLDPTALGAAVITSVVTGIIIALWPALRFSHASMVAELKEGARGGSAGGSVSRIRRVLVVVEIVFAVVLLGAAGLIARGAENRNRTLDGFRSDHALTLRVTAPAIVGAAIGQAGRASDSLYWQQLADRLDALPGVVHATAALGLPYSNAAPAEAFGVAGGARSAPGHEPTAHMIAAEADYFTTLGIAIRAGRALEEGDRPGTPRVAVVDERVARTMFGSANPIGQALVIDSASWRIVGVASETRPNARRAPGETSVGDIYVPLAQRPSSSVQLVLRTRNDPLLAAHDAMRVIHDYDRDLAVSDVQSFAKLIDDANTPYRIFTGSMISIASAAAATALIGLYALIAFLVAQRMREFGIRLALGADARSLFGLVLGESGKLSAIGIGVGLVGALGAGRVMRAALIEVSPADPITLGGVVVAMFVVTILATLGPARRAARVDPVVALRAD
ncbi:MAG: ADOP family duplicated permease [Gemmatimonadales bacterium]